MTSEQTREQKLEAALKRVTFVAKSRGDYDDVCTCDACEAIRDAQLLLSTPSPAPESAGFVPSPHEPVEGVTLWSCRALAADGGASAAIKVDGKWAGSFTYRESSDPTAQTFHDDFHRGMVPRAVLNPLHTVEKLTAFRDSVRASRTRESASPSAAGEAEKPAKVWREGQNFRLKSGGNFHFFVVRDQVVCGSRMGSMTSGNYASIEAFEAAIKSGELVSADPTPPTEKPAPAKPALVSMTVKTPGGLEVTMRPGNAADEAWAKEQHLAIEPAPAETPKDWSKLVTPNGRKFRLVNERGNPAGPGCWAIQWEIGNGDIVFIEEDGQPSIASSGDFNDETVEPNRWPLPPGTAERLDTYIDSLPTPPVLPPSPQQAGAREPYAAETWPKGVVWIKCQFDADTLRRMATCVRHDGVRVERSAPGGMWIKWKELSEDWQLSTDGGATWQPCSLPASRPEMEAVERPTLNKKVSE